MITPAVRLAIAALCGVLPVALLALSQVRQADGNYSVLLNVSEKAFNRNPMLRPRTAVRERLVFTNGYDAQYTYFAAFDPLIRRYAHVPDIYNEMMDAPPYRFARIGHVWLSWVGAAGDWRRFPIAIVWTVLLGVFASALAVGLLARDSGHSAWWAASVALVPGFWQSVQVALPEPLAAAMTVLGFWCWTKRRYWGAAACLAAAMLFRETSLIVLLVIAGATFVRGERWRAVVLMAAALAPYVAWKLHIGSVLFGAWGWDAYFFNPGTIETPFAGMWSAWQTIRAGRYFPADPSVARAAVWFATLVTTSAAIAFFALWRRPSPQTIIAAVYALMAISLSGRHVWIHVGNVQRTSTELFVWLAVVWATWPSESPKAARVAALLATACALFLLIGAHDAAAVRAHLW